jgi:hypothetical protein
VSGLLSWIFLSFKETSSSSCKYWDSPKPPIKKIFCMVSFPDFTMTRSYYLYAITIHLDLYDLTFDQFHDLVYTWVKKRFHIIAVRY